MTEECLKYIRKWHSKRGFTYLDIEPHVHHIKRVVNKENWAIAYHYYPLEQTKYIIRLLTPANKVSVTYKFSKLTISKIMFIHQVISKRINRYE